MQNGNGSNGNGNGAEGPDLFASLYYDPMGMGPATAAANGHGPGPNGQMPPPPQPQAPAPGQTQMPAPSQRPSPAVYAAPPRQPSSGPQQPSRLEVDAHRLSHNGKVVNDPRIMPRVQEPQLPTGPQGQFPPFSGMGGGGGGMGWWPTPGQNLPPGQATWTPQFDGWPYATPPGYGVGQADPAVGPPAPAGVGGGKLAVAGLALGAIAAGIFAWKKYGGKGGKGEGGSGGGKVRSNWFGGDGGDEDSAWDDEDDGDIGDGDEAWDDGEDEDDDGDME